MAPNVEVRSLTQARQRYQHHKSDHFSHGFNCGRLVLARFAEELQLRLPMPDCAGQFVDHCARHCCMHMTCAPVNVIKSMSW